MLNGYESWHDSDEIDSEIEQEAYNLLYYQTLTSTIDKVNIINSPSIKPQKNDTKNPQIEPEDFFINLVDTSDSTVDQKDSSDSDSDESAHNHPITCKKQIDALYVGSSSDESAHNSPITSQKKINALYVGSSSDDSDDEAMEVLDIDSDFIMNTVVNDQSISLNSFLNHKSQIDKKKIDNDWSVDYAPSQRSKFNNRYFETSSNRSVCQICAKKGHSEDQCHRTGPICILCGKEGHVSKRCDKAVCCVCFQANHSSKNCPLTSRFLRMCCRRCGQRGHSTEICPDIWRQYKFTIKPGPPVFKQWPSQNKSSVFCANCAKPGHFTEQCPRSRMNSRFIGPPPIMEIIKFDNFDIYQEAGLMYSDRKTTKNNNLTEETYATNEFPSFIKDINLTAIVPEETSHDAMDCDDSDSVNASAHADGKTSQFGDGFIMLSPIGGKQNRKSRQILTQENPRIQCSTPHTTAGNNHNVPRQFPVKSPTKLPGITTELLKKLFPEDTANYEKLPPGLRKKLRKKLKNLIDHGYLPGDTNMTQERMEFWLQEISTGRSLNYREKKKLLGSVSAALHSISDRVSSVEIGDPEESTAVVQQKKEVISKSANSIPELRRKRNRKSRQEKNLKNQLKISKQEKKEMKENSLQNSIKSRLRSKSAKDDNQPAQGSAKKTPKRRRKKAAPQEIILID